MKYHGLIEDNGNEGEAFGYYFPVTDETTKIFDELEVLIEKWNDECGDCTFEIERNVTQRELDTIDKHDRNGYMPRVNVCDSEKSLDALRSLHMAQWAVYKGSFPLTAVTKSYGEDYDDWLDLRG